MNSAQSPIQSGDPLLDHISLMIAEAARLHAQAMQSVFMGQAQQAKAAFGQTRLLVDDAVSFVPELAERGTEAAPLLVGLGKVQCVTEQAAEVFDRL